MAIDTLGANALASNSVTTAKIANDAVTGAKIPADAVVAADIADGSITTAKLAADAVTDAKLADNAVVTANITAANITTAKLADANVTQPKIAKSMQGWELIENKVSATDGDINNSTGNIEFRQCFSTNYLYYKLVIGYFAPTGANNNTINFQWLYGSNQYVTAAGYHWVVDRLRSDSTSLSRATSSGNTHVRLWSQIYSNTAGGIHGEINIWNHNAPVLGGTNTDRGSVYRPWVQSDLVGYEPSDDCFTRTFAHGRYDVSNPDDFMTGFVISTASGNATTKTHMSLFGYRNPV